MIRKLLKSVTDQLECSRIHLILLCVVFGFNRAVMRGDVYDSILHILVMILFLWSDFSDEMLTIHKNHIKRLEDIIVEQNKTIGNLETAVYKASRLPDIKKLLGRPGAASPDSE